MSYVFLCFLQFFYSIFPLNIYDACIGPFGRRFRGFSSGRRSSPGGWCAAALLRLLRRQSLAFYRSRSTPASALSSLALLPEATTSLTASAIRSVRSTRSPTALRSMCSTNASIPMRSFAPLYSHSTRSAESRREIASPLLLRKCLLPHERCSLSRCSHTELNITQLSNRST